MRKIKDELQSFADGLKPLSFKQQAFCLYDHKFNQSHYRKAYYSLFQYKGDWQVERLFCSYKDRKDSFELREVERNFVNMRNGVMDIQRLKINTQCFRCDAFTRQSDDMHWSCISTSITGETIPNSRYHKNAIKHGYNNKFLSGADVIALSLTNSTFEWLLKIRSPFATHWWRYQCNEELWKAVKIANRHHIEIKDTSLFADAVWDMKSNNIDYLNPKNVADYEGIHTRMIEKRERQHRQMELRNLRLRIEEAKKDEGDYAEKIKFYKDIMLVSNNLKVQVMQSVNQFVMVGDDQHICVGSEIYKYWKKKNVLVFTAIDKDNNYLATIEYDQKYHKIIQCRAKRNGVPERKEEIEKLILNHQEEFNIRRRQHIAQAV